MRALSGVRASTDVGRFGVASRDRNQLDTNSGPLTHRNSTKTANRKSRHRMALEVTYEGSEIDRHTCVG